MKAEMTREERVARVKDEANIAVIEQWDKVQAKTDVDMELAQKLQTEEQEQLIDAEKSRLFMELLEKRRKFFAKKREIEKRNRPPTQAQQRNLMCIYLKNMDGWKQIVEERSKNSSKILNAARDQLVLLVYKVTTVFNKVNVVSLRVTTADRVTIARWIKREMA
uniref:Uncharacterized protein n=1 Tax=Tanacetum cinerariifolium TaxID=118510 RepID=A0A699HFY2_TANCI|nr:hypothetical protein [Tanacetum cinerariifolium]